MNASFRTPRSLDFAGTLGAPWACLVLCGLPRCRTRRGRHGRVGKPRSRGCMACARRRTTRCPGNISHVDHRPHKRCALGVVGAGVFVDHGTLFTSRTLLHVRECGRDHFSVTGLPPNGGLLGHRLRLCWVVAPENGARWGVRVIPEVLAPYLWCANSGCCLTKSGAALCQVNAVVRA